MKPVLAGHRTTDVMRHAERNCSKRDSVVAKPASYVSQYMLSWCFAVRKQDESPLVGAFGY